MDTHRYSCVKLLTFSLPVFALLLCGSWGAASTSIHPPPPSSVLAANTLRSRGYSLFASVLLSVSAADGNFSGTLLAPPDFAFSFATAKFLNNRRPPPRPSVALLLYHTLKPPLTLTWLALTSRHDGDELRTLYSNNCLFLFKNPHGGELSIFSSPFKNPISAVKIRQPDLYVDDHLTVHGIDGVLNPSLATKCSSAYVDPAVNRQANVVPLKDNRSFLDHAMRALRRKGFNVVAAAMAVRRSELLSLTSVTVFAVTDKNFFLKPGGFRYDFRHHVLPMRHRFADLEKLTPGGTAFDTLAPNKTVLIDSVNGAVRVDGVAINGTQVYHNRWVVVVSVATSLDDAVYSEDQPPISGDFPFPGHRIPAPSPFPLISDGMNFSEVPSPAPAYMMEDRTGAPTSDPSIGTPSPATEVEGEIGHAAHAFSPITSGNINSSSPSPEISASRNSFTSPAQSTARDDVREPHCDKNAVVSSSVEGGDLFCPAGKVREMLESDDIFGSSHVGTPTPSDDDDGGVSEDLTRSDGVKIFENMNVADDLFFYM